MKPYSKYLLVFILYCFCLSNSLAQSSQKQIDSMIKLSEKTDNDSLKVALWNKLGWDISYTNFEKGIQYAYKALALAKELKLEKSIAYAYNTLATIYTDLGVYDKAIEFHNESLKISERTNSITGIASTKANIGIIHAQQLNYKVAKSYFRNSYKILRDNGFEGPSLKVELALFTIHKDLGEFDSAKAMIRDVFKRGHKYADDLYLMSKIHTHHAQYFIAIINPDSALIAIEKAHYYVKKMENIYDLFEIYTLYGEAYTLKKDYQLAIQYYENGLKDCGESAQINLTAESFRELAKLYDQMNNSEKGFYYLNKYVQLSDSLNKQENKSKLVAMELAFKQEKATLELENLKVESDKQKVEIQKQNTLKIAFAIGFALMLGIAFFIFRGYRQKKKSNDQIQKQKAEVEVQKHIVEEKNREITDSINYAKRIQSAILPSDKIFKSLLPDSFVIYRPKDIVAGDFYWLESFAFQASDSDGNKLNYKGTTLNEILFAACDCTGHGVPGAMVSVVCHNSLNRAVKEFKISEPGKILDKTRELVIQEFEKSEEDVKDGMDIALCALQIQDFPKGCLRHKIQYAGANNPLWLIRHVRLSSDDRSESKSSGEYELIEYKANKQPIGKYANAVPFDTHEIELQKGDTIYIFTDGYQDQFGGDATKHAGGKKFKAKALKELLLTIQGSSLTEQKRILELTFEKWKGDFEQNDDVCIIGIKI